MLSSRLFRTMKQVLIRNIDSQARPHHLQEVFESVGVIKEFEMPYDEESISNKGYAILEYSDPSHCEAAVQKYHKKKVFKTFLKLSILQNDAPNSFLAAEPLKKRTEYVNYERSSEHIDSL